MAKLIEGKTIAGKIEASVKHKIQTLGVHPGLAAILVGDDPASHIYVRLKEAAALRVGIHFERIHLPVDTSQEKLAEIIGDLNNRDDIHAILLQLPLPPHLNEDDAIKCIAPGKDVDGFHPNNSVIPPVLPSAVGDLIHSTGELLSGKKLLVVANNPKLLHTSLQDILSNEGIIVDSANADDLSLKEKTLVADILVVAVGRPHFVKTDMIKPGTILIDVGITKTKDGVFGDIDPACDSVASFRSPVPGGIGPVTVATVMKNVLTCFQHSIA